ncbi:cupin [Pseudoroseomonas rhizosphaerae]|uniref:Cupin n=2 Tax=Teichococcus rhizosphaerae TaxID=1335062 RepID=A0A2C7AIF0_9PROT|nr:cupin [Pseudoroseomonas rhizosphaerae]
MKAETLWLPNQEAVPNNPRLPVQVHRGAFPPGKVERAEALLAGHGWLPAWRDGIHPYVHFHTTAHEALAVVKGTVLVRLGDESGPELPVAAGDVLVLPAGTGHQRLEETEDLLVVGAYPEGQEPDQRLASAAQAAEARARIARLPDPPCCPVTGTPYPRRP